VIGGALFTLTTGSSLPSPSYSGLLPFDPASQLGILAAMIGEGRLVGVPVVVGPLAGVTLQRMLVPRKDVEAHMPAATVAGL